MAKTNDKNYPYGKLNQEDEGELTLAIRVEGNAVRIDFGKPVSWLGLPPQEARGLAELLLKHADRIDKSSQ